MKLVIYNLLGQEINTLVDNFHEAGRFNVVWNGKNKFGEFVPSGIYLYILESRNFQEAKKMMLIE
jgi:flagellar hook assembly protein FlgD